MQKRGQVTILIILAVVVAVGVIIFLSLNQESSSNNINSIFSKLGLQVEANQVESSILDCMKIIAEDASAVIGIQGGYYNQPEKFEDIGFAFIPYYYNKGSYLQPSKQRIESELSLFFDENLAFCLEDLTFNNFNLDYKSSNSKAKILQDQIEFKTKLSLTINKGDLTETLTLENYPIIIESPLEDALEIATYITDSHTNNPDEICITCVTDMASERDLFVDMSNFEENTTLIVIFKNRENQDPYIFGFLNRYE